MGYSYPYIVLLLFYVCLFFLEQTNLSNQTLRNGIRIVSAVVFFIFIGCRGYVGTDWYSYEISYSLTSWDQWLITDYEPGYSIIAKTFKYLGFSYFGFVAFITTIQIFLFDRFISRYSPTFPLPYILLIALFPILIIDIQRNFLSILVLLNGLHFLEKNRKGKYFLYVLLAMMFHLSSVVFFLLTFIYKSVINKKLLISLFIFGLLIYLLQINFYKDILLIIGSLIGGGIELLIIQAAGETETSYGLSIGIIEKIFLFILLLSFYNKVKRVASPVVINACFIYILVYLYFSTSQSFINRFANLFFWGYLLTYCHIAIMLMRNYVYSFVVIIIAFSFFRTSIGYNNILYKYNNVLFQEENYNNRLKDRLHFYENR